MLDRIEREITIEAPLDRVWDLVTGWWVPDERGLVGDRSPGATTVRSSELAHLREMVAQPASA